MFDRRRMIAGGAAIGVLMLVMVLWVLLSPGWVVRALDQRAGEMGRRFTAEGYAHLNLSPLAIRIDGAALTAPGEDGGSFLSAKSMVFPVRLGQLLSHTPPEMTEVTLVEPEIALLVNERGEASWNVPAVDTATPAAITLQQARLRYFDARNGQGLNLANVDGLLRLEAGGASFEGSAVVNSHVVRIDAALRSVARVNDDGSPLELVLSTDVGSASFSGRLSTAKVISLAGPVSLASPLPADALRWMGIAVPDSAKVDGPFSAEGALDSAGRAYAIRNAVVRLGAFNGAGHLAVDLRGERPKLQASLAAESVSLDRLVPASGAAAGDWGREALPFGILRGFDAEVEVTSRMLLYGGLVSGPARLAATLADGKLTTSGASVLDGGGNASFAVEIDSAVLPPSASLKLTTSGAAAGPLLAALTGSGALTGTGDISADLKARGQTQEEMAATLAGSASLSLANGRIAGSDLPGLTAGVRERILDGWSAAPGGTDFSLLKGTAKIEDGAARLTDVSIETPQAVFAVSGLADILRRVVELKATATAGGKDILPVPVIVSGRWAAPKIYPDIPQILENPKGGFARLRDAGLSPGD